ncbi:endonuclease domain-containing protein [Corynebacterium qintianiae]|uniref:endonuclease domain-containing protein n=1 Tax=Corynebacterium qintianiae TaxID=2709392 RepID=UPI0013EC8989|nr:hypothetical protein [Corynebacterium qintianiae]
MHNTREEDWRTPLAEKLIDLRGLPVDDPRRRAPWKHGLTAITKQIAMPAHEFAGLRFHQQRFVDAVARGRNAYEAVLIGRSAARVQGMWVVSLTREPVELALPSSEVPPTYRRSKAVVCRRREVPFHTVVHGVRTTLPVRTFIDIARDHGFAEGLIVADWLLANGFAREVLIEGLSRMGRIRNAPVVRRCIELAAEKSESPYESLARAIFILGGIGNIEVQVSIGGFRVDLLIDGWLAVEIDGDVKYTEDPDMAIVEKINRQKQLGNKGYVFLRYRPAELLKDPLGVLEEVRMRLDGAVNRGAS